MSSLISLQPRNNNFEIYLQEINAGIIQIPEFQRDFIWDLENVLNLLRSIKKNYPIGSFLLWKPETRFEIAKQVGPYFIKKELADAFGKINCKYVLDGYQRMSSLFGALTNPKDIHNFTIDQGLYNSTFNIFYNLKEQEFENYKGRDTEKESFIVPVYTLLDFEEFLTVSQKIQNEYDPEQSSIYTNRLKKIVTTFERYQMPVIEIAGGSLEEAIDIFTLLNKEGKPITPDWILSAKTYTSNFRLGDKIDQIVEKLELYNFTDKRPREVAVRELIFRSIQSSFGDLYLDNKKTDIISLSKKDDFQTQVEITINSIEIAVKFLFEELLIVDNKLLPANMQFIFLVEFFHYNTSPSPKKLEQLKKWFWTTSYSNYFTIYSPSKRKEAFKVFQQFSRGTSEKIMYKDKPNNSFFVPELPRKINLGAVRSKTYMLFMLNYSNDFNKINVDEVDTYKIMKLFSNIDTNFIDINGESSNMVVCLNKFGDNIFHEGGKKHKDLSFLLDYKYLGQYSNLFISDEMRDAYMLGDIEMVLELRQVLIFKAEKDFTNRLDIIYLQDDSLF